MSTLALLHARSALASPSSVVVKDGRIVVQRSCDPQETYGSGACTQEVSIDLPKDVSNPTVRALKVGAPNAVDVFHVSYTDKARTWEALVVPRRPSPLLFSGYTSFGEGATGDRTAAAIEIREGNPTTLLVGERAERASLCGAGLALLRPKMFVPQTGELAPVSMHRLSEAARAKATPLTAAAAGSAELTGMARIVEPGLSSDGSLGEALLDGSDTTVWSEAKKGDGHGEFVSFRVASAAPIERVVLSLPGSDASREVRSPKSLYVATDQGLFRVALPKAAEEKPGAFVVTFPSAQATSCLAISLDEAFGGQGKTANHAVSLAEVRVRTSFDARSPEELAGSLESEQGDVVASYLERADPAKLSLVLSRYESFGGRARARALAIALSRPSCSDQGAFLVARLVDSDKQVRERARAKLERCGKGATDPLLGGLGGPSGAEAAGLLALVAPSQALLVIPAAMGKATPAERPAFRSALSRALRSASPDAVRGVLQHAASTDGEVDVLRAGATRLAEVFDVSREAVLRVIRSKAATWETRYVLLPALLELARIAPKGSDVALAYSALIESDASEPVRARATELAPAVPSFRPSVERALVDASPRVRREALVALSKLGAPGAATPLLADPWAFVRTEAIHTVQDVAQPSPAQVSAVANLLRDDSPSVKSAAITALGKFRAVAHHKALVSLLYDDDEMSDVRVLATRALGEMCSHDDTDRLTKLARAAASPVQSQLERDVAFAAIAALGDLHPDDLKKRFEPLLAMGPKAQARVAAERALIAHGRCR
ncbi:MAG: HEAT repeat domain-containing protein [Polyangiaceae bacterium]